jgi:hypothetical protein
MAAIINDLYNVFLAKSERQFLSEVTKAVVSKHLLENGSMVSVRPATCS